MTEIIPEKTDEVISWDELSKDFKNDPKKLDEIAHLYDRSRFIIDLSLPMTATDDDIRAALRAKLRSYEVLDEKKKTKMH